ncbi:enoyl-CoA hydratase/isomerase family protein [Desulfatitalea alkaliphila]|uniref:Enoyl-CoA hydratase-related protein n=1 Tax=Desulfatitalea alkaliphila TaxID=2929485 RepID=A0AA41UPQ2_9BACT|nr:enoyl-CoA hydratase-related protein [Desulfatitalea alkaliphila]MCJ8500683.1 enoyl-CoA hydratase-related protein [Desulfatitalea alkaliphila]
MTEKDLLYRVERHVGTITIHRAATRNAITLEAVTLFHAALDQALADVDVRAVCITGAGDKAFCSGADLGSGMQDDAAGRRDRFDSYARLISRLAEFPKPTVARVNGHCLAGGTGFMLACDIVIAKASAQFGTPEVNVGLFPMMIGALIFRNVPRKKAMEMILLGRRLTADQALSMGLVTRVVPDADLDAEVDQVLAELAAKSPIGLKLGKTAFAAAEQMPLTEAVRYLGSQLAVVAATQDAREGIRAFVEKRAPQFKGE